MNNFYNNIGMKIKKYRENIGFSQEELAKKINIKRATLSQIENGNRKITAEELLLFAQIFNVDIDVLLDTKQEDQIKIVMDNEKTKKKETLRISVPQKNIEKFKEVLLYILNKVGAKPNIGETVLYKLLYFIDFNFYEKYEEQLIGATYIKNHYGPTPKEFETIIKQMEGKDLVKIKDKYFQYPQTKYLPLREPDLSKLKAHELKMIDDVLNELSDMNAKEISEYSHNDVPWQVAEDSKPIDYESVFYRAKPFSVRDYSEEKAV